MAKAGDQYAVRTGNIWNFAQRDDLRTVRTLIDEGIDPMLRNKVGWTALHAAANGGADRVVAFLLDQADADVDARCRAGRTPLIECARNGHLSTVKLLVRGGASVDVEDNEGHGVREHAKGTAMRSWLSECARRSQHSRAGSEATSLADATSNGGGGGGSRREKRAERQPIGMSGKAKAKALKEQRARARMLAESAKADPPTHAGAQASNDASEAPGDERRKQARVPLLPPDARLMATCLRASATAAVGGDADGDVLRARVTAPSDDGPSTRHVSCLLLDARHPLLYISDALYAALLAAAQPFILVLTKCDLVPASHVAAWVAHLRSAYPRAEAVIDVSATGRRGNTPERAADGSMPGAAARRRWLSAHLTGTERKAMRHDAARLAAACGAQLPPETMHLVRGVWKAMPATRGSARDRTTSDADAESGSDQEGDGEEDDDSGGAGGDDDGEDEEAVPCVERVRATDELMASGSAGDGDAGDEAPHTQVERGGDDGEVAPAAPAAERVVISLLGRSNVGKSALINALAGGRRVASVSRHAGHTRGVQALTISPSLVVRDTPALDVGTMANWWALVAWPPKHALRSDEVDVLCGLAPTGALHSPYEAVRAVAERTPIERAYNLQPNELREAAEDEDVGGGL